MDTAAFISSIDEALRDGQFEMAYQRIDEIDPGAFERDQALELVQLFRSCRQFSAVEKTAGVFVAGGISDVVLRRHWALSLVEQGRIPQALSIAKSAISQISANEPEYSELLGVVGRSHKQRYIESGEPGDLRDAISAYQQGWALPVGDRDWHGINLVALLERATRDSISVESVETSVAVATKVLRSVGQKTDRYPWDLANAMEASLLVGTSEQTFEWAKSYVLHPATNAFAIGGTLRQLHEVWQFEQTETGRALKPVLEYELLRRSGGSIEIEPDESLADESGFEAVYGSESFVHIQWLKSLFDILNSVARVSDRRTGRPVGTGFLIDGVSVNESLVDAHLFVTNAHVVSDDPSDEAAVRPEDAVAEFTQLSGQPKFQLGEKVGHSKRTDLDVWICKMDVSGRCEPLPITRYSPVVPDGSAPPERVFVVGHPSGGDLVVSLFNNDLVGYDGPYVHYKSPTEGGSSGSPVLSKSLQVFAVHHRTRRDLRANEGVLFEHIVGVT